MTSYWNNYPTIQNKLQAVCSYLEENVAINNEIISKTLVDFARSGGKLLRPALCLLFAELNPNHDEEKMTKIAASLEMLHMMTLSMTHLCVVVRLRSKHNLAKTSRYMQAMYSLPSFSKHLLA